MMSASRPYISAYRRRKFALLVSGVVLLVVAVVALVCAIILSYMGIGSGDNVTGAQAALTWTLTFIFGVIGGALTAGGWDA